LRKKKLKILPNIIVIEDDKSLNHLIQKTLQREGFHTEGILNGADAISNVTDNQNSILLLDYDLSDMSGKEVIVALAEKNCTVPFIIVTGQGNEKIAVEMMKLGAKDYIVKDTGLTDILPTVINRVAKELAQEKQLADARKALQESEYKYRSLFMNMLNGFAYHKIVVDKNNQFIDYVFLEINDSFARLTGLKRGDILNKRVTEVLPAIANSKPDLISIYGKVALSGENTKFEYYFEPFKKWYLISAYSPQKGYFAAILEDITGLK
jgi:FixJ family two-component response regulator